MTTLMARTKLQPTSLYLGDNGRCFCGAHAGVTAATTGRDLSGQRVTHLTRDRVLAAGFETTQFKCEQCGARLQD